MLVVEKVLLILVISLTVNDFLPVAVAAISTFITIILFMALTEILNMHK